MRAAPPDVAACQFLALICGDLQIREFLNVGDEIGPEQRERVLADGVEAFLRAYQPAPDS